MHVHRASFDVAVVAPLRRVGIAAHDAADLGAVDDGQIDIENDEIGCRLPDRPERGISAAHDVHLGVPRSFERVFDQRSDILLIFNHEDTGDPTHRL